MGVGGGLTGGSSSGSLSSFNTPTLPIEDVIQVCAVARNGTSDLLAAGSADGIVRLFRYPATETNASARAYRTPHAVLTSGTFLPPTAAAAAAAVSTAGKSKRAGGTPSSSSSSSLSQLAAHTSNLPAGCATCEVGFTANDRGLLTLSVPFRAPLFAATLKTTPFFATRTGSGSEISPTKLAGLTNSPAALQAGFYSAIASGIKGACYLSFWNVLPGGGEEGGGGGGPLRRPTLPPLGRLCRG